MGLTCFKDIKWVQYRRSSTVVDASYNNDVKFIFKMRSSKRNHIRALDKDGRSALHAAAQCSHLRCIRLLLEYGVETGIQDKEGNTALHLACYNLSGTEANIAMTLLCNDVLATHMANNEMQYPLHIAVSSAGKPDISGHEFYSFLVVKELISQFPTSVTYQDKWGCTPLHLVQRNDIAELLLRHQADPTVPNHRGNIPLHVAAIYGRADVAEALLRWSGSWDVRSKDGYMALHYAAMRGHSNVVCVLLENGVPLEELDLGGRTALHISCKCGSCEVTQALIERGADIYATDEDGLTPLHYAALTGRDSIVSTVIPYMSTLESWDNRGCTALHMAATAGSMAILLDFGASVEARDVHGRSVLHYAAVSGNQETLRELLSRGVLDINSPDVCGDTSLHIVCASDLHNKGQLVHLLMEFGADPFVKNKRKLTPLDVSDSLTRHVIFRYSDSY